jgi:hypothetical protein
MARKTLTSLYPSPIDLTNRHEGFEDAWWWQKGTGNDRVPRIGRNAGYLGEGGYVWVDIGGKEIRADAISWYLYYGKWPDRELVRLNEDRADNSISNLAMKQA